MQIFNSNKNHHTRLQDRLRNLDSRPNLTDLNRTNRTGQKLIHSPVCPVQGRSFLRGVATQSSSPPLNMPHLPQSSESQPFPLPVLPCPDIPVGGRLAYFVEKWGELTQNKMGLLCRTKRFQDTIQFNSPFFYSSDKSESIILPIITRRDNGTSPEKGSGKGTRSGNSQFLFPAICLVPKKNVKLCPVIDLSLLNQYHSKWRQSSQYEN